MLVRLTFSFVTLLPMAKVILDSNLNLSSFITLPNGLGQVTPFLVIPSRSGKLCHAVFDIQLNLPEAVTLC